MKHTLFCSHPIFSRDEILLTRLLERARNLGQPYPTSFGVVVGSMTEKKIEIFSLLTSTIPIYFPSYHILLFPDCGVINK